MPSARVYIDASPPAATADAPMAVSISLAELSDSSAGDSVRVSILPDAQRSYGFIGD